jgi:hypothetical protein
MISVQEAKGFAEELFPEAPEALAAHLGIAVRVSPMGGCDGWCLTTDNRAIIRINSRLSVTRQRFTLALSPHEKRKELESILFASNPKLMQRMSGFIGALKNRIRGKTKQEVEADFWNRYRETLQGTPMNSVEGRQYVRLRIEEWF